MKPKLEYIDIAGTKRSFHFFKRTDAAFLPFWHYHPELELTLISKGKGTRFVGDAIESYTAFDLVLLGGNLPHHWVSIQDEKTSFQEASVFQFDASLFLQFPECSDFRSLFKSARRGVRFTNPDQDVINTIMDFENLSPVAQLGRLMGILQCLSEEKRQVQLASEKYLNKLLADNSVSKISRTTNYILEHLDKKLTVDQMAEYTHMAPQSFCRWFKKLSGHSFVTFVNKTRIERSGQLLLTSHLRVQEVAFSCGYESLAHFNRTFKKYKGMSPKEFRKTYQN